MMKIFFLGIYYIWIWIIGGFREREEKMVGERKISY